MSYSIDLILLTFVQPLQVTSIREWGILVPVAAPESRVGSMPLQKIYGFIFKSKIADDIYMVVGE